MLKKRIFDIFCSLCGILVLWIPVLILWVFASLSTRSNGFFFQKRVGKEGRLFTLIKLKTMKPIKGIRTTITRSNDERITKFGLFLRESKLDELPSLVNVLIGNMSLVGPRPDVPGYADKLKGDNQRILELLPGITGPASLKYANEEKFLSKVKDPEKYNDEVIYKDKVKINLDYYYNRSFFIDLKIIFKSVFRVF